MDRPLIRLAPDGTNAALQWRDGSLYTVTLEMRALRCAFAIAALALTGCGEDEDHVNRDRPPAPISVTAAIIDGRIVVSPQRFGAGPIRLIVANQSDSEQQVTLETEEVGGSGGGIKQTSAPIAPAGTGTLAVDLREGDYSIHTTGGGIRPASLTVGAPRESAQDDLLLP